MRSRRLVSGLAALLLATASLLAFAAPAAAHDELVSTDPPAGQSLDALPSQLTLTFSGALLAEPGATQVQVTDAAGAALTASDPDVSANVVTQVLEGAATGAITVRWRVVSGDGHPISGEYSFTVTAPPTAPPSATATPSPAPVESEQPAPEESPAPDEQGSSAAPWIIAGVAVVAVVAAVAYLVISRRRRGR